MKFELLKFDNAHYASNILQADTVLKWDACGHTHHLIVRGEFGANIEFAQEDAAAIEKRGSDQVLSGKEVRYADNRFFVFLPKGYVNNYLFTVSPAKYAVFCCEYDPVTDVCKLYVPNEACLYQCDVSSSVEVSLAKEVVKKKLFGKNPETEYYIMNIPSIPGYTDGSLYYSFDGCKYNYPITKAMLGTTLYIPAYNMQPPTIAGAYGNGYKIQIR